MYFKTGTLVQGYANKCDEQMLATNRTSMMANATFEPCPLTLCGAAKMISSRNRNEANMA